MRFSALLVALALAGCAMSPKQERPSAHPHFISPLSKQEVRDILVEQCVRGSPTNTVRETSSTVTCVVNAQGAIQVARLTAACNGNAQSNGRLLVTSTLTRDAPTTVNIQLIGEMTHVVGGTTTCELGWERHLGEIAHAYQSVLVPKPSSETASRP